MKEENSQALGLGSFYWVFHHGSLWLFGDECDGIEFK
jgi:hypothetical protein